MSAPGDWMKSDSWLANAGHFLAGYAVVMTACGFSHRLVVLGLTTAALMLFWVLPKEYVYDLREESNETVWSSTVDVLGYMAGAAVVWAVIAIMFAAKVWP